MLRFLFRHNRSGRRECFLAFLALLPWSFEGLSLRLNFETVPSEIGRQHGSGQWCDA